MIIADEYVPDLLKYDHTSVKKGWGHTNIMAHDMTKRKKKGQVENNDDILPPPNGCMNVRLWYEQLSPRSQAAHRKWQEIENQSQYDIMSQKTLKR